MKRKRYKIKKRLIIMLLISVCGIGVATTWANVASFVKPGDASVFIKEGETSDISSKVATKPKARAPEPATMVMFGGGFLGMIMGFLRKTYTMMKQIFDRISSFMAFIILSPLMLVIMAAVRLTSKGPGTYSQIRVGKNGKNFRVYKFRTMKVDAEKESGPVWAAKNDNRLTPIGGFLRKSHLDELPQLVNVFMGDMSLIGPRPERPKFVNEFKEIIPEYEKRLAIKPGITGMAQAWHRYDETIQDVRKKVKYDLLYIRKMCLWADISIFFRTLRVMITGEGAR